jgi:hypothetical protein
MEDFLESTPGGPSDIVDQREYFDMPPYRYDGNIPKGFSQQIPKGNDSYYPITSTSSSGGLRSIGGHADILEITTTDPDAKLVFIFGGITYGVQSDAVVIPLVPGTHRILKSAVAYGAMFIEHSQFPDYTYVRYCVSGNMMRKIYRLKVYSTISGREYCYQYGMLNIVETPLDRSPIKVSIPPQEKPLTDYKTKSCQMCKQNLPESPRSKRERKRKNRKRRTDIYPDAFKRKVNRIVECGLLTEKV